MDAVERLSEHLKNRRPELREIKKSGKKIIGYIPGGYMPEEMVYAAGALPLCLIRGGDPEPVAESLAYVPRFLDTFCRAQVGYIKMEEDILYKLPDIVVTPISDINQRAIADLWDYYSDIKTLRYGVPHNKREDAHEFYIGSLEEFKQRLEDFTGNQITDDKLKDEIKTQNRMRELLRSISALRQPGKTPVISTRDFVKLHHAAVWADREVFMGILEAVYEELKQKEQVDSDKPQVVLTASTLAMGDGKIFDLMDEAGGEFIFEEAAEGLMPYAHDVSLDSDPIKALADTYFMKRVPPAWFRPARERVDYLFDTVREKKANGMLWYQLLYRDGYDIQSYSFEKEFERVLQLPFLKLESDYDTSEKSPFRTRMETFVEIMKQGRN